VNTVACSNTVVTMAKGKTIEEAWNISPENVTDFLETLPSKEAHCAELAVGAFYLALSDLRETKKSSWKKRIK
jgi:nitrogen fixation protein NifU and related proteins